VVKRLYCYLARPLTSNVARSPTAPTREPVEASARGARAHERHSDEGLTLRILKSKDSRPFVYGTGDRTQGQNSNAFLLVVRPTKEMPQ